MIFEIEIPLTIDGHNNPITIEVKAMDLKSAKEKISKSLSAIMERKPTPYGIICKTVDKLDDECFCLELETKLKDEEEIIEGDLIEHRYITRTGHSRICYYTVYYSYDDKMQDITTIMIKANKKPCSKIKPGSYLHFDRELEMEIC